MGGAIQACIGFPARDGAAESRSEFAVPGFPDSRIVPVSCAIADARQENGIALDDFGFALVRHRTAFADVRELAVLQGYRQEMAGFLADHLGAALVIPARAGLALRYASRLAAEPRREGEPGFVDEAAPANFAHIDYLYPDQFRTAARLDSEAQGHDASRYSRAVQLQTWRCLSASPQDVPLALCDRRSLDSADISPRTGVLEETNSHGVVGEFSYRIGGVHHNPEQRWCYYPSMHPDELLLFIGMDTERPGGGQVAHAAFDNRANDPGAVERVSLEARFYAYFA
jgi:hypothetical protein